MTQERIFKRIAAYEKLKFYQIICEIRVLIYRLTERFPKSCFKLVAQMRDAARSSKQNIREFYRRGTVGEFIRGIKISQGSLEELGGDVEDCYKDKLITKAEFDHLASKFQSADYLMARYLDSLYKMEREGTWKTPGNRSKKKGRK